MKMAAAEALYEGTDNAPFSVFTIGTLDGSKPIVSIEVPNLLSFLGKGDFHAHIEGINDLNERYSKEFAGNAELTEYFNELQSSAKDAGNTGQLTQGREKFNPNIPVSYWTFRLMMGMGFLAMAIGAWILWTLRKGRLPKGGALWNAAMWLAPLLPLFAISTGWIFTEMGRQPWIVFGVLPTISAVSPTVTAGEVLFSMILYTLLYGMGAVIELGLMVKYVKLGLPDVAPVQVVEDEDAPLSFAY